MTNRFVRFLILNVVVISSFHAVAQSSDANVETADVQYFERQQEANLIRDLNNTVKMFNNPPPNFSPYNNAVFIDFLNSLTLYPSSKHAEIARLGRVITHYYQRTYANADNFTEQNQLLIHMESIANAYLKFFTHINSPFGIRHFQTFLSFVENEVENRAFREIRFNELEYEKREEEENRERVKKENKSYFEYKGKMQLTWGTNIPKTFLHQRANAEELKKKLLMKKSNEQTIELFIIFDAIEELSWNALRYFRENRYEFGIAYFQKYRHWYEASYNDFQIEIEALKTAEDKAESEKKLRADINSFVTEIQQENLHSYRKILIFEDSRIEISMTTPLALIENSRKIYSVRGITDSFETSELIVMAQKTLLSNPSVYGVHIEDRYVPRELKEFSLENLGTRLILRPNVCSKLFK